MKERMLEIGYDPSCVLNVTDHSHNPRGDDSVRVAARQARRHATGRSARPLGWRSASRLARSDKPARATARESTDTRGSRSRAARPRARSRRTRRTNAASSCARKLRELGCELDARQTRGRGATDHHEIEANAQCAPARAKPLANPALHTVAHHRIPHLATHRDPQANLLRLLVAMLALRAHHHERSSRHAAALADHLLEFHGTPQAIDRLETFAATRDGFEVAVCNRGDQALDFSKAGFV